jgi:SAM-dependent methyltransferase
MQNLRFYISPYFIAKHYILRDIENILEQYPLKGSLLDIGCGEKPYKNLFVNIDTYTGIDFNNYSINKDYDGEAPESYFSDDYLDTLSLPYGDASFDNAVAFQVLEHHKNPTKMVSEVSRILRSGGYFLATVPFLGGIHEEPHDYQRFTKYGLKELFEGHDFEIIAIKEQGAIFSTISILLNEHLNACASWSKFSYILSVIVYAPFLAFQYLSLLLDKVFPSKRIFFNYLILVRKK